MNWQEILTILVPIFGLMTWVYNRIEKKADARQIATDKRLETIEKRLERVEETIDSLNTPLSRLEGRFDERGYWESREYRKTGTEDKK